RAPHLAGPDEIELRLSKPTGVCQQLRARIWERTGILSRDPLYLGRISSIEPGRNGQTMAPGIGGGARFAGLGSRARAGLSILTVRERSFRYAPLSSGLGTRWACCFFCLIKSRWWWPQVKSDGKDR